MAHFFDSGLQTLTLPYFITNTKIQYHYDILYYIYIYIYSIGSWLHELHHYNDVIMGKIASQITSLTIVYSTVYSDADQGKHQSSASLAFVWGIHRGPVNSPHKGPVTRKMFPFDDVIMTLVVASHRKKNVRVLSTSVSPRGCSLFKFHLSNFKIWKEFSSYMKSWLCGLLAASDSARTTYSWQLDKRPPSTKSVA